MLKWGADMVQYDKLERLLLEHGIKRTELAGELGISSRTIAKIAKGEKLSPRILGKISSYFHCLPEDLYEEWTDGASLSAADMMQSENAMYIIDKDHRVVSFNSVMRKSYPTLKKGDTCYSAIMKQETVCQACPLKMEKDEDMTFYNEVLGKWISIRRSIIDYPGAGKCGVLISRRSNDVRRNIRSRLPFMSGYDVYIEMNLTKNMYRIILPDDPTQEKEFSKDRLDDMIRRTADNLVHPNDRDAFLEFWDIHTLEKRINDSEREIHGVFRECRKTGVWDTVYITIVQEEYYGTSDVIVMALYMIMPGYAAAETDNDLKQDVMIDGQKINYDYMTGLPLRRSYWVLLENSTMKQKADSSDFCVLVTDIERFHVINNWYGREAGDALLSEIGAFLKSCDKEGEILSGYMGGDNFCTIFEYREDTMDRIVNGITEIIRNFRKDADFRPIFGAYCGNRTGISVMDAYDLCIMAIKRKDHKCHDAVCWYDDRIIQEQKAEEQLLLQFQTGMENGEITFYLQPKCDFRTGKIVGAEALARWNSPELGPVSPAVFIPVLEKAGKVSTLDYFIWQSVCRAIAKWREAGLPKLPVSVNVSRLDVFSMDIVHHFTALVEKYGLETSDIEIEITESAYVENDSIIKEVQSGLRMAGFHTLIDDFGSGYSSLNFLKDVDTDAIKLDLNFLKLSDDNLEKGENIVSSVLSMANRLNMVTIAEGVETKAQADFLSYRGCALAQGYYFYKPMPVAEFEQLLATPDRIMEGAHLSDFKPVREQEPDFEIKEFDGFDEKLETFMKTLMDVAFVVRVIDTRNCREYRLNSEGHIEMGSGYCYDMWGRGVVCKNCISRIAAEGRQIVSKYETLGRDTCYMIAKPIRIGGELYAMETAIKIMQ